MKKRFTADKSCERKLDGARRPHGCPHRPDNRTRNKARKFADAQDAKEFLRTAPVIRSAPLSDYKARIARGK
jgi:ribosomal protein L35